MRTELTILSVIHHTALCGWDNFGGGNSLTSDCSSAKRGKRAFQRVWRKSLTIEQWNVLWCEDEIALGRGRSFFFFSTLRNWYCNFGYQPHNVTRRRSCIRHSSHSLLHAKTIIFRVSYLETRDSFRSFIFPQAKNTIHLMLSNPSIMRNISAHGYFFCTTMIWEKAFIYFHISLFTTVAYSYKFTNGFNYSAN